MSTFKIEGANLIEWAFPEWNWDELTPEIYSRLFERLGADAEIKQDVVDYIQTKRIRIGYHKQYKSGGGWTLLKNITLSPGDDPLNPYVLSLIVHEIHHIKQSIWMRLSMQGELRTWQYQKKCYRQLTNQDIGDDGQAYPGKKVYWDELGTLDSNSRDDLLKAQQLTVKVSPDYRAECLPLYPLGKEFGFYWRQGRIGEAFQSVWNLITCR